jgi:hypothetical protein
MSDSDESVHHEVEVCIPALVYLYESGQDDRMNDDQIPDDEIDDEKQDTDLSSRTNIVRSQIPLFKGHQFYPGHQMVVSTPFIQMLGASCNMKPEPFSGRKAGRSTTLTLKTVPS